MSKAGHFRDWFENYRHQLTGHGNWLQGCEPGTMPAGPAESADLKVLIARLSSYQDVARGITHSFLYQLASAVSDSFVDLAFFPGEADERLMQKHQVPLWLATTSKLPPEEFDVIAISNSVLQELVNLPAALYYSGIPLKAAERQSCNSPLIIIGGSNSYNLSILHEPEGAGMVDGVLVGDGEIAFAELLNLVKELRGRPRDEILTRLCLEVEGFYEPRFYREKFNSEGKLTAIEALDAAPMPVKARKDSACAAAASFTGGPILYDESAAGASHLLMTAGCPSFCSFCKESWEQKPYRERSCEQLLAAAEALKANMGLSELALMSFNATTYSHIHKLVHELRQRFARVSIKSQRFDTLAHAPELLELQFDAGKRSYTCAMEGISSRIRTLLQKNLDEEKIFSGLAELIRLNMRQMKVFLIVTGYENAADIEEFARFLERCKSLFKSEASRVTFSFAALFRPPHTPLQFAEPRPALPEFSELMQRLSQMVRDRGFSARISSGAVDAFFSEFVAYADRRYSSLLSKASLEKGFRYRGEIAPELYRFVAEAAQKLGLPLPENQLRNIDTVFPWDDIDTGVSKEFLFENYRLLLEGHEYQACIGLPWGSGRCHGCGACRSAEEKAAMVKAGPVSQQAFRLLTPSARVKVQIEFVIPECWAWCGPNFLAAAFARRLMLDNPHLQKNFFRVSVLLPEIFCCGEALAEVEFTEFPKRIEPTSALLANDIQIIGKAAKRYALPQDFWPVSLAGKCAGSATEFSRGIDALLSRYRLKHMKQRQSGQLVWQINKGQARKCGIEKISLDEGRGEFLLELLKEPELHLLNQITGNSRLHCKRQRKK